MKIVKIEINSEKYPKNLLNIKNPPKVLYCVGNIDLLYRPAIAIIGGLFVITNQLITATLIAVGGIIITLIGIPVYMITNKK